MFRTGEQICMQGDIFMEMNSLVEETIYLSSQGEKMATTDFDVGWADGEASNISRGGWARVRGTEY